MHYYLEDRVIKEGEYIVEFNATVRKTAKELHLGKSTVHKDVTTLLKNIDYELYKKVKAVLKKNLLERHIRGGLATKNKYLAKKQ